MPIGENDPKKPLSGEESEQDPLYGEGGEKKDVTDPESAEAEGREHARESGEEAAESSGGGGQEGV